MAVTYTRKKFNGNVAERRDRYIGGSDAGTIMGVNPWKSPYTLYLEKTGQIEPDDISDNDAVWWGTQTEEIVAKRFSQKSGLKVSRSNISYSRSDHPYMVGHIDRKIRGRNAGLECKTTSSHNRTDFENAEVPPAHYAQIMHYLAVTGWKTWYYAVERDHQFYWMEVPRNEEYITALIEKEAEFWNMVQTHTPPEIDGSPSTTESIHRLYPFGSDDIEVKELGTDIEELIQRRADLDSMIKGLKTEKYELENKIKSACADSQYNNAGAYIVNYKNAKAKPKFDVDTFKEANPELYEQFLKDAKPSRRLSITKKEEE